jgi:shikimate dehydrogenase
MTDRYALLGNSARHSRLTTCGYPDLGDETFDLVVNATSASMCGELPPVIRAAFAPGCAAYDLAKTDRPSPSRRFGDIDCMERAGGIAPRS